MSCKRAGKHRGKVSTWLLCRDGDTEAVAVELCIGHAGDLVELTKLGEVVPMPARPRVTVKATQLKTIPQTAHLKLPEKQKTPRR